MVVNGMIWPKEDVEPRNYRLHLLNGTDSRFLVVRFRIAATPTSVDLAGASDPLQFTVIGSDQGLASSSTPTPMLLSEPGSRYDIVFNFAGMEGQRIIMENIGGDEPFGGDLVTDNPDLQLFGETNRVMAFDVVLNLGDATNAAGLPLQSDDFAAGSFSTGYSGVTQVLPPKTRKVALFEGKDEFGRLQPLLGTAEPAKDYAGVSINWPAKPVYAEATLPDGTPSPLTGPMEGSIAWHSPTTENPALGATEEWEIWNMTGDAHPVHLHLVHFEILERQEIVWDSATNEDDRVLDPDGITTPAPNGGGTYLVTQPTVQHNSVAGDPATYGIGFRIVNPTPGAVVTKPAEYVENAPKDMVTALPGQVTRIKAHFDKPGRYVWHCHILSHEDHEMMRVMYVGPGANPPA